MKKKNLIIYFYVSFNESSIMDAGLIYFPSWDFPEQLIVLVDAFLDAKKDPTDCL